MEAKGGSGLSYGQVKRRESLWLASLTLGSISVGMAAFS